MGKLIRVIVLLSAYLQPTSVISASFTPTPMVGLVGGLYTSEEFEAFIDEFLETHKLTHYVTHDPSLKNKSLKYPGSSLRRKISWVLYEESPHLTKNIRMELLSYLNEATSQLIKDFDLSRGSIKNIEKSIQQSINNSRFATDLEHLTGIGTGLLTTGLNFITAFTNNLKKRIAGKNLSDILRVNELEYFAASKFAFIPFGKNYGLEPAIKQQEFLKNSFLQEIEHRPSIYKRIVPLGQTGDFYTTNLQNGKFTFKMESNSTEIPLETLLEEAKRDFPKITAKNFAFYQITSNQLNMELNHLLLQFGTIHTTLTQYLKYSALMGLEIDPELRVLVADFLGHYLQFVEDDLLDIYPFDYSNEESGYGDFAENVQEIASRKKAVFGFLKDFSEGKVMPGFSYK